LQHLFDLQLGLAMHCLPQIRHPALAAIFGLIVGVFGSTYNTSKASVVAYEVLQEWEPNYFRNNLHSDKSISSSSI
jgi:hypothetical protein